MRRIEKENVVDFIQALMENDYNTANKHLGILIKEKLRNKLMEAKHVKAFGKDSEKHEDGEKCDECEKNSKSKKSKKGEDSKNSKMPPWLKKIKAKKNK